MELTRRFVFRGNASSYGGRIYRPKNDIIITGAASSLTVVGGVSASESRGKKFANGFVSIGSASTSAQGAFTDTKQAIALTYGKVKEEELTTTTKVSAAVERIVIGVKPFPRLSVGRVAGSLTSFTPSPREELSIRLGRDAVIDGVEIDGYPLKITLNKAVFEQFDTMSKLEAAGTDPEFIKSTNDCLFRGPDAPRQPESATGRARDTIYATIVNEVRWAKKPHPKATIDHHSIKIEDWGTVFFGEILITSTSRRVTMLRAVLGSPDGGFYAASEYETNGQWYPPLF